MFEFVVGEIDRHGLETAISKADLIPHGASLDALFKVLERVASFPPNPRYGFYNIQRLYLSALEALGLREDTIPGARGRGELVFFLLGKFSNVIADYEAIYFQSSPKSKYQGFVRWLRSQAPSYYDESDSEIGYGTPDAVTLSTIHAAKGMQWPVVFVPCLRKNRFPSTATGAEPARHAIWLRFAGKKKPDCCIVARHPCIMSSANYIDTAR
jgi:DNA helicase-2/ATP-dependent DNA helicase PcrA